MSVMRLGYVHIRVTDLEEARDHYSNTLGMSVVHEEPGKLHLKCWDEWDHHSLVLEEGGVGLVKLGYKVLVCEDDLGRVREALFGQFGGDDGGRFSRGENHDRRRRRARSRLALRAHPQGALLAKWEFTGTDTGFASTPRRGPGDVGGSRRALGLDHAS